MILVDGMFVYVRFEAYIHLHTYTERAKFRSLQASYTLAFSDRTRLMFVNPGRQCNETEEASKHGLQWHITGSVYVIADY